MTATEIIERIDKAFSSVTLGDGISMREANVIDDYGSDEEQEAARRSDDPLDWRRISDDEIVRYWAAIAYADAEGFRYYIPAFMCYCVKHLRDCETDAVENTIKRLYPGHMNDRQLNEAKYGLLDAGQEHAIRQFLNYMAGQPDYVDLGDVQNAIQYWNCRLADRKPIVPVLAYQMRRGRRFASPPPPAPKG